MHDHSKATSIGAAGNQGKGTKMNRRSFTSGILAAVAVLGLSGPGAAQEVTLRVAHFLPPASVTHARFIKPWTDKVTAESNGRIRFEIYPAMQLGGRPPQLFDQVRDGVADIVWTLPGYTRGRFPITEVFELPFVTGSAEATSQAVQEFAGRHLRDEYKDVRPLVLHTHAPGTVMMAKKQIRVMEDFRGTKVRAPHFAMTEMLKALGATPVSMPIPEVFESLSKGVIDGTLNPWEVATPLRLQEAAKFHTEVPIYASVFLYAMNRTRYDALPADLKRVIDANSGAGLARQLGRIWDEVEGPGRDAAQRAGGTFYKLPADEEARWRKAGEPVIAQWVATMKEKKLDGDAMLAEARALIRKHEPR